MFIAQRRHQLEQPEPARVLQLEAVQQRIDSVPDDIQVSACLLGLEALVAVEEIENIGGLFWFEEDAPRVHFFQTGDHRVAVLPRVLERERESLFERLAREQMSRVFEEQGASSRGLIRVADRERDGVLVFEQRERLDGVTSEGIIT